MIRSIFLFVITMVLVAGCSTTRYSPDFANNKIRISEIGLIQPVCDLEIWSVGGRYNDINGSALNSAKLSAIIREEVGGNISINTIKVDDLDAMRVEIQDLINKVRMKQKLVSENIGGTLKNIMDNNENRFYMVIFQNAGYSTAGNRALTGMSNVLLAPAFLSAHKAESRLYLWIIDKQKNEIVYFDSSYAHRSGKFYKGDNLDPTDEDELKIQVKQLLKKFKELQS